MKLGLGKWLWCAGGMALVLSAAVARGEEGALRMSWADANHPSGIYHAAEAGTLAVVVENGTGEAAELKGAVEFGLRVGEGFKALSVTPVKATALGAGARAKIPLAVTFAGTGTYELRWVADGGAQGEKILNADGVTLECIFAPRGANDSRWLGLLPKDAGMVPGYLTDLAGQTGVQRYLLDERFAFDAATGVSLGVGAALGTSAEQVDALFAEAVRAKVGIVLRVTVPMAEGVGNGRAVEAFHQYVADTTKRARGAIAAIVIAPEKDQADRATFRAFYLAGYSAAKANADQKIVMLGAGTATTTRDLLLAEGLGLGDYVDAVAVTDTSAQPALVQQVSKLPVWVLPPRGEAAWGTLPAVVGLTEGAAVVAVPPTGVDRGVVEHLLGGAVFYQKLRGAAEAPYVATFQGDGYAVAAVAGFSAGTPLDAAWPELARTRTVVSPVEDDQKPAYANLEVGDDSGSMRVVDAAGSSVDSRDWDTLYVPAADRVVYVLQGGSAEDLISVLRSARTNRLPVMEVSASVNAAGDGVAVKLTNISASEIGGTVRIVVPNKAGATVLGEKKIVPVSGGKTLETTVGIAGDFPTDGMVIVEIATDGEKGIIQRTAVRVK